MNPAPQNSAAAMPQRMRERRRVPACGMLALPLFCGDEVEIVDPQGLQVALVAAFDASGAACTSALGVTSNTAGARMAECLARDSARDDAARLRKKLREHRIDLSAARACELLGGETHAGASAKFICERDALGLFCAPGEEMKVDRGDAPAELPPGELIIYVRRVTLPHARAMSLPEPLADARADVRVAASTASAYEISAGEYIQIIDVAGRQCSDFQCFPLRKLERGKETCLDATTTRALTGKAYPAPGLHAKFYDVDFDALVEVVQDTCGRHDSFGLACTAKYYDDAGYPGHANCSENFNAALAQYPVTPRKGWMAMNLFFNTFFDDAYQLTFDDPWSRPGDYVLLRALTDLVCVSSACPCDIDPANGWDPTDIHVRLYARENLFKRAVAFRKTSDSEFEMTKPTGFHARTEKLTRNFTDYANYWLANEYTNHGALAEYWACREGVVVADLSPLRKAEVTGPDAAKLMQHCVTRDMRRLGAGQVVYTAMCNESGGMIDDGTVFRLAQNNFRWIGGADASIAWLRKHADEQRMQVWVKESTEQLHNLQVQGPKSLPTLREIIWTRPDQARVDELAWFRFSIARIGGEQGIPIVLSRTGYTGERGYEIFCHPKHAVQVWDAVWEAGRAHNIKPLGLTALDMLRIEAGLIFAGNEFGEDTDPFEAGIGFCVALTTPEDFTGKDALQKRKANPQRKLAGIVLAGEQPAAHGDRIYHARNHIGVITSGVFSPVLQKNIALARLNIEHARPGTKLEIGKLDRQQKRIACEVTRFPHYDAGKERVRGIDAGAE